MKTFWEEHMQENRPVDNDEIEIDLVELFGELKRNIKLIAGTTLAFIVAAAIYCFMIAKPVYEYTALISFPSNVGGSQINGFMETIKDDIKPAAQLKDKNNKIVDAKVLKGAPIIKVTFEGESVEKVKQFGDAYMKMAFARINKVIVDKEQQKYDREIAEQWASKTCDDDSHIDFQVHDISFSDTSELASACSISAGHLLFFKGSEFLPASFWLRKYYSSESPEILKHYSFPS